MSHNIARINNADAIAYVGETPWHRLGTRLHSATDLDAALEAAGLGWTVSARPLYVLDSSYHYAVDETYSGSTRLAPAQAITRDTDGVILGVVGPGYHAIQHLDGFRTMSPALAAGSMTIECAGALGNGATVWMLSKLASVGEERIRETSTGQADILRPYLLMSTSHDGSRSLRITPTSIRVVCQNTLNMSEAEAPSARALTIKHTESAADNMKQFAERMDRAVEAFRAQADMARHMAETKIDAVQLRAFIETLMPLPAEPGRSQDSSDAAGIDASIDASIATTTEAAYAKAVGGREFRLRSQTEANIDESAVWQRWLTQCDRITAERAKAQNLSVFGRGNRGESVWDAVNGITEYIDHTAPTVQDGSVSEYRRLKTAESAAFGSGSLLKSQAWTLARQLVAV